MRRPTFEEARREFLSKPPSGWQPPPPPKTREELRAERRTALARRLGSDVMADLLLCEEETKALERRRREIELSAERAKIDAEIVAYNAETARQMRPLQAESDRIETARTKVAVAMEALRISREQELNRTLKARLDKVTEELNRPHRFNPPVRWSLPNPGEHIAPMRFPDDRA